MSKALTGRIELMLYFPPAQLVSGLPGYAIVLSLFDVDTFEVQAAALPSLSLPQMAIYECTQMPVSHLVSAVVDRRPPVAPHARSRPSDLRL